MKAYGEWMYRSTFSWPRQYLVVSGQIHAPAALTPEKEPPVTIGQEVGWITEPVWTIWTIENSWPHRDSNSDFSVAQPVASRYTDVFNCITLLFNDAVDDRLINNYELFVWTRMNTNFIQEHTLLVSAELVRNWREQKPSNQSDIDCRVMTEVGRVHRKEGIASDFIYVPQYVIVISIYV
jgi:hypothetical protein